MGSEKSKNNSGSGKGLVPFRDRFEFLRPANVELRCSPALFEPRVPAAVRLTSPEPFARETNERTGRMVSGHQ